MINDKGIFWNIKTYLGFICHGSIQLLVFQDKGRPTRSAFEQSAARIMTGLTGRLRILIWCGHRRILFIVIGHVTDHQSWSLHAETTSQSPYCFLQLCAGAKTCKTNLAIMDKGENQLKGTNPEGTCPWVNALLALKCKNLCSTCGRRYSCRYIHVSGGYIKCHLVCQKMLVLCAVESVVGSTPIFPMGVENGLQLE